MTSRSVAEPPKVVIVGGGLAGLSAAVALASSDCQVDLYEARRALGGRAGSFRDPATGEPIRIKASKKIAFRVAQDLKEAI